MDYQTLKVALKNKTGCTIQHNGWTCGTCFFAISKTLDNQDWQNVLLFRGDSKEDDLDNLPDNREESLEKVLNLCK